MKQVEYFRFLLPPDDLRPGRPKPSRFRMSLEDAAERYPGAVALPETRELRLLPDTPEEHEAAKFGHFQGYSATPSEAEALAGVRRDDISADSSDHADAKKPPEGGLA